MYGIMISPDLIMPIRNDLELRCYQAQFIKMDDLRVIKRGALPTIREANGLTADGILVMTVGWSFVDKNLSKIDVEEKHCYSQIFEFDEDKFLESGYYQEEDNV